MILNSLIIILFLFVPINKAQDIKEFLNTISSLSREEQVDSIISFSNGIKNDTPQFLELNRKAYDLAVNLQYNKAIGIALSNIGLSDHYSKNYDSAINNYKTALSLLEKTDNHLQLGLLYNRLGNSLHLINRNDEAIANFRKSIALRKKINDKVGIGYAYTNIGLIFWRTGRYDSALVNYEHALEIRKTLDDKKLIASNYNNIAVLYYHWGRFEIALDFYLKSYSIREELEDFYGMSLVLNNIGLINKDRNQTKKAKENFYDGLIYANKSGNYSAIGYSYNGIASIFEFENQLDSANFYYQKSLSSYTTADHFGGMVMNLIDLAEVSIKMEDFEKAENYLNEAFLMSEPRSEQMRIAQVYLYRSDIQAKKGNLTQAINFLQQSLEIAEQVNKVDLLVDIYERFSDLYSRKSDFKKAIDYYKLFKIESDKLISEKSSNKVMELEFENQKSKELKEKEILLEKQKAQSNMLVIISIAFGLLAVVLILIILYRQRAAKILKQKNDEIEKQKDELNKKNSELNEVNQTKDKFFSIIAHDLKNPFGALIGYTSFILDEYEDLSDEEIVDMVEKTNSVSNHSFQLLENLLTWSRSQTGKIESHPKEINLNSILEDVITLFKEIASKKNIKLDINSQENILVVTDEDMVRTIFRNLISNAIKFSHINNQIDISLQIINGKVLFSVRDYGIGMDEDTLKSLFRIDVNISNIGTGQEKGTGLGLILANEFVQKINGNINVESELGKGSKFSVSLSNYLN